jgi:predicted transcriptional regulator
MSARILHILSYVMLTAFAVTANAQDVEEGSENSTVVPLTNSDLQAKVDKLVDDLSSTKFATRQTAMAQILKLDAAAVAILEAKLTEASEPTSTQLRQVIPRLRKDLFDNRVAALDRNSEPSALSGMPDWERFVNITGDPKEALPVYVEMLRAEGGLFADRMFSSSELSVHLEERSKVLREACDGQLEEEYPVASAAALMLIASDESVFLRRATSTNISESLQDSRFGKLVTDGFHAETLRGVASEWLKRPGIAVDRPLLLSMEYQLPVGREIALKTLERPVYSQSTAYSLLYLGLFKQTDALAVVEKVLNDESASRPVWPPKGKAVVDVIDGRKVPKSYTVQARDVALAVAIHLRGRLPREFGMKVMPSSVQLFSLDSMGFEKELDRSAAFSKYRAEYAP